MNQASKISTIKNSDSEVYGILQRELTRESETLELIASENFVSYPILEMAGGIMTNKYAEGYPGARYYGGCQHVDEAKILLVKGQKNFLTVNMQMFNHIPVLRQIWRY